MKQQVFKLGELFCGPGGIACGAMRSHSDDNKLIVKHAWANDYDAEQMAKKIKEEITKSSKYRNVNNVNRLR